MITRSQSRAVGRRISNRHSSVVHRSIVSLAASATLVLITAGGCGYAVGPQYNPEIRSVEVPVFRNDSDRRGIEYQITEAVHKQIQSRTPFRLTSESGADTILKGRIVSLRKQTLGRTGFDDARELQLNLVCEVTWEDARTGAVLAEQDVKINPDLITFATQSEFAPETGQSLATAQAQAFERLARSIVDMMEVPPL